MNYQGIWDSTTNYNVNDLVLYNYNYYLANAANINVPPPAAQWEIYTIIQSIAYIIANEIGLDPTRAWIYDQDYIFPTDPNLFLVIEYIGAGDFSNNATPLPTDSGMSEQVSVLTRETYRINLLSKNEQARLIQQEARSALKSYLAQQQQEIFQYKIGTVSKSITNLSQLEGSGMYNRLAFDVPVLTWYAKDRVVDYFDTFSSEIKNDNAE